MVTITHRHAGGAPTVLTCCLIRFSLHGAGNIRVSAVNLCFSTASPMHSLSCSVGIVLSIMNKMVTEGGMDDCDHSSRQKQELKLNFQKVWV